MIIFLLIYLLFLMIYIALNIYGVSRLQAMRIKNDATGGAIFVYLLAIAVIIGISLLLITTLSWPKGLH